MLPAAVKPTFDRILLRKLSPEVITKGGIYIPAPTAADQRALTQYKVLATGPGRLSPATGQFIPLKSVKLGDVVMVPDLAGFKFKDEQRGATEENDYAIVREDEILAVLS